MARARSRHLTLGVFLLAAGVILLATRFAPIQSAPAWLLGVGVAFALLAIVQRSYASLIAGMVLLGLGAGMILGDRAAAGMPKGAWTLVGLGGGFVGVYLLALVLQLRAHWWPLLVGVVLVAVGAFRYVRRFTVVPPEVEIAVRTWWPAALVIAGLFFVVKALRS